MCRPGLRVLIATAQKKGEGGQRAVCSGSFAQPYLLVHLHMDAEEARSGLIRGIRSGWVKHS